MAALQAKALFDFESGGAGELSFNANEFVTILRQDVGDGWWEAKNNRGQKGLVPESYFEITSFKEPSIPPPPAPTQYQEPSGSSAVMRPQPPAASTKPMSSARPPGLAQQSAWNSSKGNGVGAHQNNSITQPAAAQDDDWDDSWDDDDDNSSTTTETQDMAGGADTGAGSDNRQGSRRKEQRASVRNPFNRFSQFAKSGGEAYLFDSLHDKVPDSDKTVVIINTGDGVAWRSTMQPFGCSITSPKKETKFHGIKSYIAYQLVPTFSNIQVSRRYKHFDWLHERLVEKYCTVAIPPLPEKQISGRFDDDFVSQRLRQLQNWVDRMCKHGVIAQSDVFQHFLTCTDDKKWKEGKRKAEKDKYLGGKFFLTVQTPAKTIDSRQAEQQVEKFGRFVKSMDDSVKQLNLICESNVKKHQGPFKKEFQKLGDSFSALSKSFEFDDRPGSESLTKAIDHTGQTYSEIGQMYADQPKNDMYFLLDGLQEYKGLLSTFPDTLMMHKAAMTKVQEASSKNQDPAKMTESDLQSMQSRADVITYSVLAEMQHFHQFRVADFKNYCTGYLQGQINFYKEITAKLEATLQQY